MANKSAYVPVDAGNGSKSHNLDIDVDIDYFGPQAETTPGPSRALIPVTPPSPSLESPDLLPKKASEKKPEEQQPAPAPQKIIYKKSKTYTKLIAYKRN